MKERRRFLKRMGGLVALMALSSKKNSMEGTSRIADTAGSGQIGGPFVHTVFFWLVDDSLSTAEKFTKELNSFINNVDEIRTKHVGRPADTHRVVIDSSYSYCLIVTFDSKADHDLYQEHKLHKLFIENTSGLWNKVLVYDSVRS